MTSSTYDVVAVGNAIIDVLQSAPDAFLAEENIAKGGMTLIDEARADHLTARFADAPPAGILLKLYTRRQLQAVIARQGLGDPADRRR